MADDAAERIRLLVDAARAQKLAVGNSRGTTGPLGELYACELLNLAPAVDGMRGYDATDAQGKRVQIKSRAPEKGDHVNPIGTVGRFTSWEFDYALLVLLDGEYRRDAIWKASPLDLAALQAKVRNPASGIRVSDFMRVARRIDVGPTQSGGARLDSPAADGENRSRPPDATNRVDIRPRSMNEQGILEIAADHVEKDGYVVYDDFIELKPVDQTGSMYLFPIKLCLQKRGYSVHEGRYRAQWSGCGYPGRKTHFHSN